MRAALESARAQRYDGDLRIAVIFDREEPDHSLVCDGGDGAVPVRVLANDRTPGLAGARNCGVLSSTAELVAFLDDDDRWLTGKLARQVERLVATPRAEFATTDMRVEFEGQSIPREAGVALVTHEQLLASRMAMLHSSTFLIRRAALVDGIGLVDEAAPASQNEDWDLLLRASRREPIAHVQEPLVAVRWGSSSLFARAWESRIAGARWVLGKHPDIRTSAVGYARLLGQIAFAHAALGQRREAMRCALESARTRWREPRAYLALAVSLRLVSAQRVMATLHKHGRGV
jgi:glycosyltransferase involved in cell wall biosynthesis